MAVLLAMILLCADGPSVPDDYPQPAPKGANGPADYAILYPINHDLKSPPRLTTVASVPLLLL